MKTAITMKNTVNITVAAGTATANPVLTGVSAAKSVCVKTKQFFAYIPLSFRHENWTLVDYKFIKTSLNWSELIT